MSREGHGEIEDEGGHSFFYFEGQRCFLGEEPFVPFISLDMEPDESKKKGFNTVAIKVSLRPDADLEFREVAAKAHQANRNGLKIVFDLDFGLFENMRFSIESDALFSAMAFSLKAFRETVLIPYSEDVLGVIGFRGNADFYSALKKDFKLLESFRIWLSEVYSREEDLAADLNAPSISFSHLDYNLFETSVAGRFLLSLAFFEMAFHLMERLGEELSANCPLFLLLEFKSDTPIALKAAMLHRARLSRVLIAPYGADDLHTGIRFQDKAEESYAFFGNELASIGSFIAKPTAILLPPLEKKRWIDYKPIGEAASYLFENRIPFRMIPEILLPGEWDDVETLIIASPLSKEGRRKVLGYLSTEGTLVAFDQSLGLKEAMDWRVFTKQESE